MPDSVYNAKLPAACSYCVYGKPSPDSEEIFCKKRGVTGKRDSCRKYKYDPLKRIPEKINLAETYNPEDFRL